MRNGTLQNLTWLNTKTSVFSEMIITSDNDWIILNVNASGYFRVIYDQANIERLQRQLMKDPNKIPVCNRAQIIGDAFQLMVTGLLDAGTALSTTAYLSGEKEFVVWSKAIEVLNDYVEPILPSDMYGLYKQYILKTFTPIFNYQMDLIGGDLLTVHSEILQ
ncbi:aminopeptidase Q [Amia ocellicauda]|uniref:aminopeptidase Q n=1 Tax=Amia ocellicauda TaxID=2972642 RepID=UPI0034642DB3